MSVGIALAGGGFLGAAYELGALSALAESINGLELTRLDAYVGVSAGSFIAAGLANGIGAHEMVRLFIDSEDRDRSFDPARLVQPAYRELSNALRAVPGVARSALWAGWQALPSGTSAMLWRAIERSGAALPTGLLSAEPAQRKLTALLTQPGRSNDFRRLAATLRIVATDIDSGQAVAFGGSGFERVPISQAVAASSAIPGLFAPVRVKGRHYVDGALNKTLHASLALDAGATLVFCINPLVPYHAGHRSRDIGNPPGTASAGMRRPHGDLPSLLSQSVRTAIHSRMTVGLEKYRSTHPQASILLFEPSADDARTFHASMFSVARRRELCEHAYQQTRADLRERAPVLQPILKRHGLSLNQALLAEPSLRLFNAANDANEVSKISKRSGGSHWRWPKPVRLDAGVSRLRGVLDDLDRTLLLSRISSVRV